jgi:non-heme chloroperoxidase
MHPEMVVSLALNEPPALGILNGLPNSGEMLKAWAANLASAKEALKGGDVQRGIPLWVMELAAREPMSAAPRPTRK